VSRSIEGRCGTGGNQGRALRSTLLGWIDPLSEQCRIDISARIEEAEYENVVFSHHKGDAEATAEADDPKPL